MIVIKLGGSLIKANTLSACLVRVIQRYQHKKVVLVIGGGEFADHIRRTQQQWQFDDYTAHAMALLAMQQSAWLVKSLQADFDLLDSLHAIQHTKQQFVLWLPNLQELDKAGVPANWDITSDSLAAWLANRLCADELILLKSADINPQHNLAQLAEHGIIDKAFCHYVANSAFNVQIKHYAHF